MSANNANKVWTNQGNGQSAVSADAGRGKTAGAMSKKQYQLDGEWGYLREPCRFCRHIGVYFLIDAGQQASDEQPMRCDACKRTWSADSATA